MSSRDEITLFPVVSDKDRAPIWRALIRVNGVQYEASLWLHTRRDGTPIIDQKSGVQLLHGPVKPAEQRGVPPQNRQAPPPQAQGQHGYHRPVPPQQARPPQPQRPPVPPSQQSTQPDPF